MNMILNMSYSEKVHCWLLCNLIIVQLSVNYIDLVIVCVCAILKEEKLIVEVQDQYHYAKTSPNAILQ